MIKIAIWGYGYHGHDLEAILSFCWQEKYRITYVLDRKFEEIKASGRCRYPIAHPDQAKELFDRGLFDAVLIGVFDPNQYRAVEQALNVQGIPVLALEKASEFFSPEETPNENCDLSLLQDGYQLFVYRNHYLSTTLSPGISFVTDRTGRMNRACYDPYYDKPHAFLHYSRPSIRLPAEELSGDWCCLCRLYSDNYWHFTYEVLDRLWLMERSGYRGRYLLLRSSFAEELLLLAGVDLSRITWVQNLERNKTYHFERLFCVAVNEEYRIKAASVLHQAASAIVSHLPPLSHSYPKRIYVKRIGRRKLILPEAFLEKYQFKTIVPENLSVAEQIRCFEQADIVLSPHGANSTNCLYMHPGSVLIETFPHDYIRPCCLETLATQDVAYFPLPETQDAGSHGQTALGSDYSINTILLEMTMQNIFRLCREE